MTGKDASYNVLTGALYIRWLQGQEMDPVAQEAPIVLACVDYQAP